MNIQRHGSKNELLFHYTKFDTAFYHILKNQNLLLNPVALMNDIYETENRLDSLWNDAFNSFINATNFADLKRYKVRLISFVRDGLIRGFDNQLMWSHYGEQYQGVCLVFDKNELIKTISEIFSSEKLKAEKITYKLKKPVQFNESEETGYLNNVPIMTGENYHERNDIFDHRNKLLWKLLLKKNRYRDIFFRKNRQWRSENEFRILIYDKRTLDELTTKNENLLIPFGKALLGIIVGPKFNYEKNNCKINCLKSDCRDLGINFWSSKYEDDRIIIYDGKRINYEKALLNI